MMSCRREEGHSEPGGPRTKPQLVAEVGVMSES